MLPHVRSHTIPLAQLIELFLTQQIALHYITKDTARNVRSALRPLASIVGERSVRTLCEHDVVAWLSAQEHLSAATRRSRFSMMRQFSKWLIRHNLLEDDPTLNVRPPRLPRSIPRALPSASVGALLAVCPDRRGRAIVLLMVESALRCCEVAGLEVGDWDRLGETVRVVGKGGHERVVPVMPDTSSALRAYLAEWPTSSGPIFRSYRKHTSGLKADSISRLVARWMADAGIKELPRDGVSAHALRHTGASDVLDQCGDLRIVQELLGHRFLASTAIYLRRAGLPKLREGMAGRSYTVDVLPAEAV